MQTIASTVDLSVDKTIEEEKAHDGQCPYAKDDRLLDDSSPYFRIFYFSFHSEPQVSSASSGCIRTHSAHWLSLPTCRSITQMGLSADSSIAKGVLRECCWLE